jgi:cell division protein FtsZ
MGIGSARGEGRSIEAAGKAINSPLLEASMDGAYGVLLSIAGGSDLGLFEINEAASLVQESAHPEANIIFGTIIDDSLGDEVRVTVIAAGFDAGAPTHKKLDPGGVGSTTAAAQAGQVGGGAPQQAEHQGHQGTLGQAAQPGGPQPSAGQPSPGAAPQQPAAQQQPAAPQQAPQQSGHPGHGSPQGGLPQAGVGSRGYQGAGGNGSLPGRAVPVTEDPADDDVDVPPFMRR